MFFFSPAEQLSESRSGFCSTNLDVQSLNFAKHFDAFMISYGLFIGNINFPVATGEKHAVYAP
jgi:hypothetical protein